MSAVTCDGIELYDIRTTLKAEAGESISMGESCYISNDGKVYVVDDGKNNVVHGWALHDKSSGEEITLVTTCRMRVDTTQTIGARIYTGNLSGGSAPSTTLSANGVVCGFAVEADLVFCNVPTPAADG